MDSSITSASASAPPIFEDGLGRRFHAAGQNGEPLDVLELRDELTAVPAFEFALRERVAALGSFQHSSFSRVRAVLRVGPDASKLGVVSDRLPGIRLSQLLAVAKQQLLALEINAALCLIRQLVPAVAALHERMPGLAHGAISPERLLVLPGGRLVVTDHVIGAAVEQLHYSHDQLWKELRIPLLKTAGAPCFDQRGDVVQIGAVALALILGRPLEVEEYPDRVGALAESAWALTASGGVEPLPAAIRGWLARALQLDARQSFPTAVEARVEFDRALGASDSGAQLTALKAFLAEYARCTSGAARPAAPPPPPPAPPPVVAASVATPVTPVPSGSKTGAPPVSVPAAPPLAPTAAMAAAVARIPVPASAPVSTPFATPAFSPEPQAPPAPAPAPRPVDPAAPPTLFAPRAPKVEPKVEVEEFEEDVEEAREEPKTMPRTPWWRRREFAAALALLVLASGGTAAGRWFLSPPAVAEAMGTLVVTTNPPGAAVLVDDQPRGMTPITMELAPGSHVLRVVGDGDPRIVPLTITAGGTVSQSIDLPRAAPQTGQLQVQSEPTGARVSVDGVARGAAPVLLDGLTPGLHSVALSNDLGTVTHQVNVEAGATASLVVPMTAPRGAPVSGWLAVNAPFEVQIAEDARLLGTSRTDRIMVSAGRHEVDITNDNLGYRATRVVNVAPGQVAVVNLDVPNGSLALNAQPWADVWINGERVGETPIGNLTVPIGTHEVVFRHPQLGEEVVRATVTAGAPTRLSVDLRKR